MVTATKASSMTLINLLKSKTSVMYHQLQHTEILCSAHNAFMRFAWISEQTAIISLYSINLSVFITEAECLLRGTKWVFKSDSYSFVLKRLRTHSHPAIWYPPTYMNTECCSALFIQIFSVHLATYVSVIQNQ